MMEITHLDEFLGNDETKVNLKLFLQNNNTSAFLLIGPSGSGKTTICKLACLELNDMIQLFRPDYDLYVTHKELTDAISKFMNTKSILDMMCFSKKVLFLDDLDILLSNDRYANSYLIDLINTIKKSTNSKILMTCSQGNEKKARDIKKKVQHISILTNPCHKVLVPYLRNTLNIDAAIADSTIQDYCSLQFDNVRRCILNASVLESSIPKFKQISQDQNIIDIVGDIVRADSWNIKTMNQWLSSDPCLISYVMYDNVFPIIKNHTSMRQVVDTYATSSIMETYFFCHNDMIVCDIYNLWRCGVIKYIISKHSKPVLKTKIKYTTIPTRSSTHFAQKKAIQCHFSNFHVNGQETSWGASTGHFTSEPVIKTMVKKIHNDKK